MAYNPIIIETQRLILKGLSPQDMTFIFNNLDQQAIMKLLGLHTDEEYKKEEYKQKNGYAAYNRSFILFLLTDKASEQVIGRCGLHNWNPEHHRAELGYNITDENFKRRGFMTEAVQAVLAYGFNQLNLHRIEALVATYNIPSLKILHNQNFVKEELLREHYYVNGIHEDSIMFSKLKSEFLDNHT